MIIMDIRLIQIGNDKGILLSKSLLKRYGIKETVQLTLEKNYLILRPKPREGWEEAFEQMHKNGDDKLLIDDIFADEVID